MFEALEASDGLGDLGSLNGVETGVRRLIRRRPLETEELRVDGFVIRVPTLAETARVKAWLILRRNATRDYLDFSALADRMGEGAVRMILEMDDYYEDQRGPDGMRVATQLVKQLAEPQPYDLSTIDLRHFRGTLPRWQEWGEVVGVCRQLAADALHAFGERELEQ